MSMSPAMLRGLRALDAAPNKVLTRRAFFEALAVTPRGRWLVLNRMIALHLVVYNFSEASSEIALTWAGMRALADNDRKA